ncbi:hypothetical protein [Sphingomonas sp. ERG5]|uniref:hypothetical protein n=1 Tax=Sphingomonas sp. ERG5 TaxID=1381597 RepID=UPI00054B0A00|nr:hypothetical protein [Sphingomonas sp. ERG5]
MSHSQLQIQLAAMELAAQSYQAARPEIGALSCSVEGVDQDLLHAVIRAYDLESDLRGYTMRLSNGELPNVEWITVIDSHNVEDITDVCERSSIRWSATAAYSANLKAFKVAFYDAVRFCSTNAPAPLSADIGLASRN